MEDAKVEKSSFATGYLVSNQVPNDVAEKLSPTSAASDCFAGQKFSRKLQEFLLNYRTFVTAQYPLTDE
jgi:hypothetical protein